MNILDALCLLSFLVVIGALVGIIFMFLTTFNRIADALEDIAMSHHEEEDESESWKNDTI